MAERARLAARWKETPAPALQDARLDEADPADAARSTRHWQMLKGTGERLRLSEYNSVACLPPGSKRRDV